MGDPMLIARVHELEAELRDARRALRAEIELLIERLTPASTKRPGSCQCSAQAARLEYPCKRPSGLSDAEGLFERSIEEADASRRELAFVRRKPGRPSARRGVSRGLNVMRAGLQVRLDSNELDHRAGDRRDLFNFDWGYHGVTEIQARAGPLRVTPGPRTRCR